MVLLLIWILFGIATAMLSSRYGRDGCGWFAAGFFLGPFGLILLLIAGDAHTCPFCKKGINRAATICPYCRSTLTPAPPEREPQPAAEPEVLDPKPTDGRTMLLALLVVVVVIAALVVLGIICKR